MNAISKKTRNIRDFPDYMYDFLVIKGWDLRRNMEMRLYQGGLKKARWQLRALKTPLIAPERHKKAIGYLVQKQSELSKIITQMGDEHYLYLREGNIRAVQEYIASSLADTGIQMNKRPSNADIIAYQGNWHTRGVEIPKA